MIRVASIFGTTSFIFIIVLIASFKCRWKFFDLKPYELILQAIVDKVACTCFYHVKGGPVGQLCGLIWINNLFYPGSIQSATKPTPLLAISTALVWNKTAFSNTDKGGGGLAYYDSFYLLASLGNCHCTIPECITVLILQLILLLRGWDFLFVRERYSLPACGCYKFLIISSSSTANFSQSFFMSSSNNDGWRHSLRSSSSSVLLMIGNMVATALYSADFTFVCDLMNY